MAVVLRAGHHHTTNHRHVPQSNRNTGYRGYFTNTCLTTVSVSGTTIGFHTGLAIGSSDPTHAEDETLFYGFSWEYPATTGLLQIRWGDAGVTQLTDINEILVTNFDGTRAFIANWNASTSAYEAINLEYAQGLNNAYDTGDLEPWCFTMGLLPEGEIIHYSFTELLRGA